MENCSDMAADQLIFLTLKTDLGLCFSQYRFAVGIGHGNFQSPAAVLEAGMNWFLQFVGDRF